MITLSSNNEWIHIIEILRLKDFIILYYSKLVRCVREKKNIDLTSVSSTIIFIFCIRYTTLTLKNPHSLYIGIIRSRPLR